MEGARTRTCESVSTGMHTSWLPARAPLPAATRSAVLAMPPQRSVASSGAARVASAKASPLASVVAERVPTRGPSNETGTFAAGRPSARTT